MLTLLRFRALAESYGADLRRWPAALRGKAEALLAISAEAREILADARVLDDALRAAGIREDASFWQAGEESAALARLRSGVGARLATRSASRPRRRFRPAWQIFANAGWMGMATSGLAIVAGLLIGSAYAPPPAHDDVLAMLQPATLQILAE